MSVDKHTVQADKTLTVYYNSACPVCDAGIRYQKNRLNLNKASWCDIAQRAEHCDDIPADVNHVRKYLHLRDHGGQVRTGIDAFITLWELSDNDRWLARIFRLPLIKPLAKLVYAILANVLYSYNRLCRRW